MAKTHSQYVCQVCGKISSRSFGRCPSCDSWDSMIEEVVESEPVSSARAVRGLSGSSTPRRLSEIEGDSEERMTLPMTEFARVLGGNRARLDCVIGATRDWKIDLTLQRRCRWLKITRFRTLAGKNQNGRIKCGRCACCELRRTEKQIYQSSFSWSPRRI